jgi:hypothetical protein
MQCAIVEDLYSANINKEWDGRGTTTTWPLHILYYWCHLEATSKVVVNT